MFLGAKFLVLESFRNLIRTSVLKRVTLNGVMAVILRCDTECVTFESEYVKLVVARPILSATKIRS